MKGYFIAKNSFVAEGAFKLPVSKKKKKKWLHYNVAS